MTEQIEILLIDDDAFANSLHQHILASLGFIQVRSASGGSQALKVLDQGAAPIDVMLLDLNMPNMDGIEFLRELAARGYAGSLVLVSGEDERVLGSASRLAARHGIAVLGHLQKPVSAEALGALLSDRSTPLVVDNDTAPLKRPLHVDELRKAINGKELVNYYQPKVSVPSGEFIGVETLVRWQHPTAGLVFPDAFIPLAEESGLINDLTLCVLEESLRQLADWHASGLQITCAINISTDDLTSLDFPELVDRMIRDAKLPHSSVILELTESRLVSDMKTVTDILTRLSLKRIGLAIDDFGQGHSSLAQLKEFPFQQLKIDKEFVFGAHSDETKRAIYSASRDIARQLGMESVAEGVETQADWDMLCQTECDAAQGYFVAKPMPADEIPPWAQQWAAQRES